MTHGQISSSSINFNFLLVTSCHCSFLAQLQQTPRMQLIFVFMHFLADVFFVFFHSVQTPVPPPLGAICRTVSCQQILMSPFATFLLPFSSFHASPYPSSIAAMPVSIGALVSIFFTWGAECVVTLSVMTPLQRDEQFFLRQMRCHGIDNSANSEASTCSLPRSSLPPAFSQTFLRTCSTR